MAIFYGIDKTGLKGGSSLNLVDNSIPIIDNTNSFIKKNGNVIVEDLNGKNVFDKNQNSDGVDFIIIYSDNYYYLYTWQNASNSKNIW